MANTSIYNAFERMWSHVVAKIDGKSDSEHNHIYYGECSTLSHVTDKTVTVSNFKLEMGAMVIVKFDKTNTAPSPTLNVNGTGAKPIYIYGTTAAGENFSSSWRDDAVVIFVYDGTGWVRNFWENTTYTNASLGQGCVFCSTDATTTAKTASLSNYSLKSGGIVSVKFEYDVPANSTLNINDEGKKNIYYKSASIGTGIIKAGDIATFIFNGGVYNLISIDRWNDDITNIKASLDEKVPNTRTINGKALSTNITLSPNDIGVYTKAEIDEVVSQKSVVQIITWEADD